MRFALFRPILVVGVVAGSTSLAKIEPAASHSGRAIVHAIAIRSIAAGGYTGYAVLSNGHVWAWGDDLEGQIGDAGPWASRTVPVEVQGLEGAVVVAGGGNSAYVLRSDGTVWAWGDDSSGELADNKFTANEHPILIHTVTAVSAIAAGAFAAYAIRRDGTAWAWGDNAFGQLGTGSDSALSTVPKEVARLNDVAAVASGSADGYAMLKDGTVWAWGDDSLGQLGGGECRPTAAGRVGTCLGSSIPREVPDLDDVVAIAAGGDSGYALRSDGSVWAWGDDGFGELGDGAVREDEDKPVHVKGLGHVLAIAAGSCSAYALLGDGTVWAWGRDDYGQLGDGDTLERSLPVQVQGITGIAEVVAGGDMAFALKSDGELWAWGANAYGQLGDGSVASRDLPARVLGLPMSPGLQTAGAAQHP